MSTCIFLRFLSFFLFFFACTHPRATLSAVYLLLSFFFCSVKRFYSTSRTHVLYVLPKAELFGAGRLAAEARQRVCEVWVRGNQAPLAVARCVIYHRPSRLIKTTNTTFNLTQFLSSCLRFLTSCTAALECAGLEDKVTVHVLILRAGAHLLMEVRTSQQRRCESCGFYR